MKNLTLGILLVSLLAAPFTKLSAQHINKDEITHWSLGLKGGISYFDFAPNYHDEWRFGWNGGLVLEYSINPVFGFGLDAGYYNYDKDAEENTIAFKNQTIDGLLFGSVNLSNLLSPARTGAFWRAVNIYTNVGGGVGVYNYNVGNGESDFKVAPLAAAGLNIEFNLGRMWALGLGADYRWHFRDDLSGFSANRTVESVNATLLLRYKFAAHKKKHVRNLTTAEFYPQPAPVVIEQGPDQELMQRVRALENSNTSNMQKIQTQQQKIQELEQKSQRINQEIQRTGDKIDNLNHQDVANLVVENIEFVNNQKDLTAGNRAILDQVSAILLNNMSAWKSLDIRGYTDATGSESGNIRLSETRAKLVSNYLISKGIPASKIASVQGYGSIKPIASNSTVEGRNKNRRVEVHINK